MHNLTTHDILRLSSKEWRLDHMYKIKNKNKELVTFKRNRAQKDFNLRRHSRNIILKSRQLGFTTFEAIDALDDLLFTRNFDALFIAHGLEPARDIFDNKISLAWENFPLRDKYLTDLDSARKLKVGFGDNSYSSIVVDTSGRSGTFSRLHVTEFAKLCKDFPRKAHEVHSGSIPAVPITGRVDIESTAEESYGLFHDMFWTAYKRGLPKYPTQFKAHFYNWRWEDAEIKATEVIHDIPSEFREYQKKHELTDKEISYYYLRYISLSEHARNWATMKREYPTTPEEAFEGSGNKLFNSITLSELKVGTPIWSTKDCKVYKNYEIGHSYGVGCDVAEGIGKDSSTMCIWDFTYVKPEVVATYSSSYVNPDIFAFEIKNLCQKYEYPIVAVERNNHGHAVLQKLREIYPSRSIYKDERGKEGWLSTGANKPVLFLDLNSGVDLIQIELIDKDLISEAAMYEKEDMRFVRNSDDGMTAHFDLLTAAAIGYQMRYHTKPAKTLVKKTTTTTVKRGNGIYATR